MTSGDRAHFSLESSYRADVSAILAAVQPIIHAAIPGVELVHIGGTSIPDALTKGDVDLLVRVPIGSLEESVRALARRFPLASVTVTSPHSVLLADQQRALPLDLHVVEAGSSLDLGERVRALLLARPDALAALDRLKKRFDGRSMESYRRAKDVFFQSLLQGS